MTCQVFDYRSDGPARRNFFISPEVRARMLRIDPRRPDPLHYHPLGHEVFVVMEGRGEFIIEGVTKMLGPGQACSARAGEVHTVRAVGEEPLTIFLCVTPHIQPTHVFLDEAGNHLPDDYRASFAPPGEPSDMARPESNEELTRLQLAALNELADSVESARREAGEQLPSMAHALDGGEMSAATAARDGLWCRLEPMYQASMRFAELWNAFTARTVG